MYIVCYNNNQKISPPEAKDTGKIRTKPVIEDNDPQKSPEKECSINNKGNSQEGVTTSTVIKEEKINCEFNPKYALSSAQTIMRLEKHLEKNKDKYIIELLEWRIMIHNFKQLT